MHKDEAGEDTVCVTIAFDTTLETYAPDAGIDYSFTLNWNCETPVLQKILTTNMSHISSWNNKQDNDYYYGRELLIAIEFYYPKNIFNGSIGTGVIQFNFEENVEKITSDSDLFVVLPYNNVIYSIYLKGLEPFTFISNQIHYIKSNADPEPSIQYSGNPQPC